MQGVECLNVLLQVQKMSVLVQAQKLNRLVVFSRWWRGVKPSYLCTYMYQQKRVLINLYTVIRCVPLRYSTDEISVSATPNAIGALNGSFAKFNHQFCHLASGDVQGGL